MLGRGIRSDPNEGPPVPCGAASCKRMALMLSAREAAVLRDDNGETDSNSSYAGGGCEGSDAAERFG